MTCQTIHKKRSNKKTQDFSNIFIYTYNIIKMILVIVKNEKKSIIIPTQ